MLSISTEVQYGVAFGQKCDISISMRISLMERGRPRAIYMYLVNKQCTPDVKFKVYPNVLICLHNTYMKMHV